MRSKFIDLADGLPPVLPIVIYNGDMPWNRSLEANRPDGVSGGICSVAVFSKGGNL